MGEEVKRRPIGEKELRFHAKRENLSQLEQRLIADLQEARLALEAATKVVPPVQEGVVLVVQRCATESIEVYARDVRIKHLLVTRWQDHDRARLIEALGEPWADLRGENTIQVARMDAYCKPMNRPLPSAAGWTKVVVVTPDVSESAGNGSQPAHSRPATAPKSNAPQRQAAPHGQGQGNRQPARSSVSNGNRSQEQRPVVKSVPEADRGSTLRRPGKA